MDINKIIEKQNIAIKKQIKKQNKGIKKIVRKQDKQFSKVISAEGRVPIPAKRKHEVEKKYNYKCAVCKKAPAGVTLQIHHKNMNNHYNALSNLELLCPNHHYQKHGKGKNKKRY